LEEGVAFAELDLSALIAMYPPAPRAHTLPRFPGIERDISVVVDESRTWGELERVLEGVELSRLERREFVGVYRGKPLERGRKSVTFRLHFRDPERTLRHEEVDPEVDQVVKALSAEIGAELRA
jgi:phenylalanyl-tRNA synthetase beta chain